MIGVVAMSAAGLGTFASSGAYAAEGTLTNLMGEPASSSVVAGTTAPAVDVSRGIDRPTLERQMALQTAQREQALDDVERDISATAEVREREAEVREQKQKEEAEKKRLNQWVLPVTGYNLSARFGQQSSLWSSGSHTGLDFAGPSGSEIVSVAAGTVTSAGYEGSYGNRTVVTLADGTQISYSHQSRIAVSVGDQVQPGQPIGYTGATGNVTGPHLHLEVELPGSGLVDPIPVLRQHGIEP